MTFKQDAVFLVLLVGLDFADYFEKMAAQQRPPRFIHARKLLKKQSSGS